MLWACACAYVAMGASRARRCRPSLPRDRALHGHHEHRPATSGPTVDERGRPPDRRPSASGTDPPGRPGGSCTRPAGFARARCGRAGSSRGPWPPAGRRRRRSRCRGCRGSSWGSRVPRARRRTRARPPDREAVHFEPGVGFSGIGLTCTQPRPRALSSFPSRSARQAWSLMSRISAYSMDARRPVACVYSNAASIASATFHLVLTGTRVSRSSSSGACRLSASVTGQPLAGQLAHRRDQADRRDGDPAGAHPQAVRSRCDHPAHRPDHHVVVGHAARPCP